VDAHFPTVLKVMNLTSPLVVKLIEAVLLKDPFKSFFLLMLSFLIFDLSCCITISVAHCHINVALVTEVPLSISVKPQQNIY